MEEIWKEIKGYEGKYLVSNLGRVKTIKTGAIRKSFKNVSGFYVVTLFLHSKAKTYNVHRLMYDAFIGYPADPNLCYVYFKDGDRNNCVLDNLECDIMETSPLYDGCRRGRIYPEKTKQTMKERKKHVSPETIAKASARRSETFKKKREMEAQGLEFTDYSENYGKYRKYFSDYHREYYKTHKVDRTDYYKTHKEEIRKRQKEYYDAHIEEKRKYSRDRYWAKKKELEENPEVIEKKEKNYLEEIKNILCHRFNKKK